MGNRKTEARQRTKVESICFIDPDDVMVKEEVKIARSKLELPMEAAMPS